MLECKNKPLMLFSFCIDQIKLRYLHISSYKLLLLLKILSHAVNFIYFKLKLQTFVRTLRKRCTSSCKYSSLFYGCNLIYTLSCLR